MHRSRASVTPSSRCGSLALLASPVVRVRRLPCRRRRRARARRERRAGSRPPREAAGRQAALRDEGARRHHPAHARRADAASTPRCRAVEARRAQLEERDGELRAPRSRPSSPRSRARRRPTACAARLLGRRIDATYRQGDAVLPRAAARVAQPHATSSRAPRSSSRSCSSDQDDHGRALGATAARWSAPRRRSTARCSALDAKKRRGRPPRRTRCATLQSDRASQTRRGARRPDAKQTLLAETKREHRAPARRRRRRGGGGRAHRAAAARAAARTARASTRGRWRGRSRATQRITSTFGWRIHPILKTRQFHTGIDIAGARRARAIVAAGSGKVIYAGYRGGYGNMRHDRPRQRRRDALRAPELASACRRARA